MADLNVRSLVDIAFCVLVLGQLARIGWIDMRTRKISNVSVVALAITWLLWRVVGWVVTGEDLEALWMPLAGDLVDMIIVGGAALLFTLVFERLTGKYGMGGGDIKLIAVMGLYLGITESVGAVLVACIGFAVYAAVQQKGSSVTLPFGPWLSLGWAVMLLLSLLA